MIALTGLFLLPFNPASGTESDDWQSIVTEDIWFEHSCKAAFFSHVIERETKSGKIVMVKIHCDDKRSFDAVRPGTNAPFTFSECTPREQQAC
ncbi:MAG: hypothetical protein GKS00_15125 [Alphaproteobacteria bacterium]|nr:hypothetical protein [Alphaproteobacteria bacterium]